MGAEGCCSAEDTEQLRQFLQQATAPDPSSGHLLSFERVEDEEEEPKLLNFDRVPSSSSDEGSPGHRTRGRRAEAGQQQQQLLPAAAADRASAIAATGPARACANEVCCAREVATVVPEELLVTPPSELTACAGIYQHVTDMVPNGQPLWRHNVRQAGGDFFWLFSGRNGKWFIGGEQARLKRFECSMGYIRCCVPHKGLMPDQVEQVWQWGDGTRWRDDPGISVVVARERWSTPLRRSPDALQRGGYSSTGALERGGDLSLGPQQHLPASLGQQQPPASQQGHRPPSYNGGFSKPPPLRLPPQGEDLKHTRSHVLLEDDMEEDRPIGIGCELDNEPPICAACLGDGKGKSVWSLPEQHVAAPDVRR